MIHDHQARNTLRQGCTGAAADGLHERHGVALSLRLGRASIGCEPGGPSDRESEFSIDVPIAPAGTEGDGTEGPLERVLRAAASAPGLERYESWRGYVRFASTAGLRDPG